MGRICVFAGSRVGAQPEFVQAARALGEGIAQRGADIVYGGADDGMMGSLANAALARGGLVYGVVPRLKFPGEEWHTGLTKLYVVRDMHRRKALMANLSDVFIALPGGFGTLDELLEIITWRQVGLHHKPIALLNVDGYYDQLLAFIDHAHKQGFITQDYRSLLMIERDPVVLLDRIEQQLPKIHRRAKRHTNKSVIPSLPERASIVEQSKTSDMSSRPGIPA